MIGTATRARSDAEIDSIVAAAAGNPRVAQRLAALEAGGDLPPSLASLVARRIDLLPQHVRRAGRDAAVVGDDIPVGTLAAISGIDAATLRAQLRSARELLLIEADHVRFRDDLTRSVAAAGLPLTRARELHARAARRMERAPDPSPAAIARHWAAAGDDERTIRWAVRTGELALHGGASSDAVVHFDRALSAARRCGRPSVTVARIAEQLAVAAKTAALPAVDRVPSPRRTTMQSQPSEASSSFGGRKPRSPRIGCALL